VAVLDPSESDPTAVYRHFPTKEELVNTLVDQFLQTVNASLNTKLTSPRERILDRAMCTRREFEKHPDVGVALVFGNGQPTAGLALSRGIARDLEILGVTPKSVPSLIKLLVARITNQLIAA